MANNENLIKVQARVANKAQGIITIRLLDKSEKPVAAASLPVSLLDELGAALMMTKQKLLDDGIIKSDTENHPALEFTVAAKF